MSLLSIVTPPRASDATFFLRRGRTDATGSAHGRGARVCSGRCPNICVCLRFVVSNPFRHEISTRDRSSHRKQDTGVHLDSVQQRCCPAAADFEIRCRCWRAALAPSLADHYGIERCWQSMSMFILDRVLRMGFRATKGRPLTSISSIRSTSPTPPTSSSSQQLPLLPPASYTLYFTLFHHPP